MSTLHDADTVRVQVPTHRPAPDDAVTPVGMAPPAHPVRPRTAAYSDANPRWSPDANPLWSPHPAAAISSSDRLDDPFFQTTQPPPSADDEVPLRLPRKRGSQIALVAVTILVAAGVGALAAGWANRARTRAAATVVPAPAPEANSAPHPPPILVPVPAPPPPPVNREAARRAEARIADRVQTPPARTADRGELPSARTAEPADGQPARRAPRHNVVWSDRLQRLVPAESVVPGAPAPTPEAPPPAPPATSEAPLPP